MIAVSGFEERTLNKFCGGEYWYTGRIYKPSSPRLGFSTWFESKHLYHYMRDWRNWYTRPDKGRHRYFSYSRVERNVILGKSFD